MANYVVFRASAGQVPSLGGMGSADVSAAANAAATMFRSGPGSFLYVALETNLTRYATSVTTAVG